MIAAQGDTKPCIYSGCSGTMQFAAPAQSEDAQAWLCSVSTTHVHVPANQRKEHRPGTAAPANASRGADRATSDRVRTAKNP